MLLTLNLDSIATKTIDVLIDMVDIDGDGEINHHEFCNCLNADDLMKVETLALWAKKAIFDAVLAPR